MHSSSAVLPARSLTTIVARWPRPRVHRCRSPWALATPPTEESRAFFQSRLALFGQNGSSSCPGCSWSSSAASGCCSFRSRRRCCSTRWRRCCRPPLGPQVACPTGHAGHARHRRRRHGAHRAKFGFMTLAYARQMIASGFISTPIISGRVAGHGLCPDGPGGRRARHRRADGVGWHRGHDAPRGDRFRHSHDGEPVAGGADDGLRGRSTVESHGGGDDGDRVTGDIRTAAGGATKSDSSGSTRWRRRSARAGWASSTGRGMRCCGARRRSSCCRREKGRRREHPPLRARGAVDRGTQPSQHGRHLRLRPDGRRHLLLRDGVPGRHQPRGPGQAGGPAARGTGRAHPAAGLRLARRSARGRAGPPGRQAGEHHPVRAGRHGRCRQGRRLRAGQALPRRPDRATVARNRQATMVRDAALHGARELQRPTATSTRAATSMRSARSPTGCSRARRCSAPGRWSRSARTTSTRRRCRRRSGWARACPHIERLVLRCLAKSPADRPQSARALLQELEGAAVGAWSGTDAANWWVQHRRTHPPAGATPS